MTKEDLKVACNRIARGEIDCTGLEYELVRELLRLLAQDEARGEQGWQPIETAPKGERILIGGGGCPRVQENELRCFKVAGYCFASLGTKQQPTHWMRIPPPPTPEQD